MILIVGGAGFIGSHVVATLFSKGIDVCVLDNLSTGHKEYLPKIPFINADLSDKSALDAIFNTYTSITSVMHFASFIPVGESVREPLKYYQNNLTGTLNLLESMLRNNVDKFIFSSSAAVYGDPLKTPINEEHPRNPINPYGKSKLMVEEILKDYNKAYGLKYIALRYFNAAGAHPSGKIPEQHVPETHLIPLAFNAATRKGPELMVFGNSFPTHDGTCLRDYIHVSDLCNAHLLALKLLDRQNSGYYNLGNGNAYSVLEVIKTTERITGLKVPYQFGSSREGDPAILVADSSLAKKELDWRPEREDLEIIIEDAWRALRPLLI